MTTAVACKRSSRPISCSVVACWTAGGWWWKATTSPCAAAVSEAFGWEQVIANLATVPVVGLGLGSVAGLGSARVVTSHYSLLVRKTAQMFVAGPPVVACVGQATDKETLGGADLHAACGAVDDAVDSELEAFARTKRFLSYLPPSVHELPPRGPRADDPNRRESFLIDAIPRNRRQVYKMRSIIEAVVDRGSFLEIGRQHGKSVITGLARLDGWPVGLLASDPYHYAGAWTAEASLKVVRFVDLTQAFHLPMVHLVDIPGFLIGEQAERAGTIRHGARALAAVFQAQGPWCAVLVRKCFGVAGAAHMNTGRAKYRYAWPSGDWGSLPVEGGIEAAYKAESRRRPTARPASRRSRRASNGCAARSAQPRVSGSRR